MKKFLAASSLLAIMLAACGQPAGETGPIKIGFISPLSGEVASVGNDVLHGTQLQVQEINAAGGINGRMIELIAEDGRCTGADAASAIQKLINIDQVVAIEGAGCSGESLAAAPIAEAAKVVMISPVSTSPEMVNAGDFIFRTVPNDALKTAAMAQYFESKGWKKIAIISENTDFSIGFRDSLKKDMGEDAVVFDEVVEPGTKDFRTLMNRLKDVDFDVFFPNGNLPTTIAIMLQQMREQGMTQMAVGNDVAESAEVITLAGEAVEGLQVINTPSVGDDTEFGKKFTAAFGEPQANTTWASQGYDTMGVLAQAIGAVGTESEAIRDYLYDLPVYHGIIGDFHFDKNGDVVGIKYALKEVRNGAFVKIADIEVQ